MSTKSRSLFLINPLILIILFCPLIGFSQPVSEDIALAASQYYAEELFGPVIPVSNRLFVDLDDQPEVYCFLFSSQDVNIGKSGNDTKGIITVFAGANRSHAPVIQMHRGLPDHILNLEKIKALITEKTSVDGWEIRRYLYTAPFEFCLEFKSPMSEEYFFVRTSDLEIMRFANGEETPRLRSTGFDTERSERIKKKWDFVEGLYKNKVGDFIEKAD